MAFTAQSLRFDLSRARQPNQAALAAQKQQAQQLTAGKLTPYNTFNPGFAPGSLAGGADSNAVSVNMLVQTNPDQLPLVIGTTRSTPSSGQIHTGTGIMLGIPRRADRGSADECTCNH